MRVQHTSGPWESLGCGVIQVGRDNVTIAKAQKSGKFGHKFPPGQAEANARLMASAPEMLAALEKALFILEQNEFDDHAEHLRGVIAKAKGLARKEASDDKSKEKDSKGGP